MGYLSDIVRDSKPRRLHADGGVTGGDGWQAGDDAATGSVQAPVLLSPRPMSRQAPSSVLVDSVPGISEAPPAGLLAQASTNAPVSSGASFGTQATDTVPGGALESVVGQTAPIHRPSLRVPLESEPAVASPSATAANPSPSVESPKPEASKPDVLKREAPKPLAQTRQAQTPGVSTPATPPLEVSWQTRVLPKVTPTPAATPEDPNATEQVARHAPPGSAHRAPAFTQAQATPGEKDGEPAEALVGEEAMAVAAADNSDSATPHTPLSKTPPPLPVEPEQQARAQTSIAVAPTAKATGEPLAAVRPAVAPHQDDEAPRVHIGQVDIIVQAPPPVPQATPAPDALNQASRLYLRRL